jgi:hypothetical protein
MRDSRRRRSGKREFFPQAAREYGSQIITALEQAWAAIRDQHPEIPDVIVTGAGSNQKGMPEGYRLRGHPLARAVGYRFGRPAADARTVRGRRAARQRCPGCA